MVAVLRLKGETHRVNPRAEFVVAVVTLVAGNGDSTEERGLFDCVQGLPGGGRFRLQQDFGVEPELVNGLLAIQQLDGLRLEFRAYRRVQFLGWLFVGNFERKIRGRCCVHLQKGQQRSQKQRGLSHINVRHRLVARHSEFAGTIKEKGRKHKSFRPSRRQIQIYREKLARKALRWPVASQVKFSPLPLNDARSVNAGMACSTLVNGG